ncbi:MAG: C2H2-type zinc finger protein [Promethearchaeota archaeon]
MFIRNSDLSRHLANRHNIGVKWHECPECDYKAKNSSHLTRHLANKHDIGIKWHYCPKCDYKAK